MSKDLLSGTYFVVEQALINTSPNDINTQSFLLFQNIKRSGFVYCKETEISIMLSKSKAKIIRSLYIKKIREQEKQFIVEGEKMVGELMIPELNPQYKVVEIFGLSSWIKKNRSLLEGLPCQVNELSEKELNQVSSQKNPNQAIAIAGYTQVEMVQPDLENDLLIAVDNIQDPGNLGTIIRLADWFAINHIVISKGTVDPYNTKCIQSSMGSIFRICLHFSELAPLLQTTEPGIPIFGTVMDGENIYKAKLSPNGILVFGNESRGIDPSLDKYLSHRITIARALPSAPGPESLNVAVAASIICGEFRRQFPV